MKLHKRPFLIAVTGGIASGKSLVCKWLEDNGYKIYYSDTIAHTILKHERVKKCLIAEFGTDILQEDEIDRKKLGDLVFNEKQKLTFLNDLIHPEVLREMQNIIDSCTVDHLIFEVPLLFEKELDKAFDFVMNIYSSEQVQIDRLIKKRSMKRNKAEQIITSQYPGELKIRQADLTITNNGDIEEVYDQLDNFIQLLKSLPFRDIIKISDLI